MINMFYCDDSLLISSMSSTAFSKLLPLQLVVQCQRKSQYGFPDANVHFMAKVGGNPANVLKYLGA